MQGCKQNLAWSDVKNQIKTKSKVVKNKRTTIDFTFTWSDIITRGAQRGKIDHLDMESGPKNLLP
jgi:hypothetical protein